MVTRDRFNGIAWMAAVIAVWLAAWWHLSVEWRLSEQYQFGWGIPVLFAWIAWRRWDLPPKVQSGPWICAGLGFVWLILALGEVLRWRDPVWRMTGAVLAFGAVFFTALFFYRVGDTPLLRRQWFALAFLLLAVPWPVPLEQWISQGLLNAVTAFCTTLVNGMGIPALQEGNIIELRTGFVGVTEACSGISSLHASLVASIFMGEFFRLGGVRRCVLIALSLLVCVSANCFRVLVLTMILNSADERTSQVWHDPVGWTATVVSFIAIGFLAILLKTRSEKSQATVPRFQLPSLPGIDGFVVLGCFITLPFAAWLAFHPASGVDKLARWTLNAGNLPAGWSAVPVEPPSEAAASLHFTRWQAYRVTSPEGWIGQVVHLYWQPGEGIPGTAFFHTPASCLSGQGWVSTANSETWVLPHRDSPLTVATYRLRDPRGNNLVAIQSLLVGGSSEQFREDLAHPAGTLKRLTLLMRAPSHTVDEEILAYIPDLGSSDLQTKSFSVLLDLLIQQQ